MRTDFFSYAIGIGTQNRKGEWLEVYYPKPVFKPAQTEIEAMAGVLGYAGGNTTIDLPLGLLPKIRPLLSADQQAVVDSLTNAVRPLVITLLEQEG